MRREALVVAMALASIGASAAPGQRTIVFNRDEGLDDIEPRQSNNPAPKPRLKLAPSPAPRTEHKHSREIARRLRQQARLAAKRQGNPPHMEEEV